ncbi:hypothetical protein PUN28_011058 [Cardiocondyla obscurior]|uniref:Uncharacterized protein n=1 Tax=Cardiocondyla obscurior TaxID=286306 RepID=A0AAW2FNE1_9HYME
MILLLICYNHYVIYRQATRYYIGGRRSRKHNAWRVPLSTALIRQCSNQRTQLEIAASTRTNTEARPCASTAYHSTKS